MRQVSNTEGVHAKDTKVRYATVTFFHKYSNWKLKLRWQRGNTSDGLRADKQIYLFGFLFFFLFFTFHDFYIFSKDMLGSLRDSLDLWEIKILDYEAKCLKLPTTLRLMQIDSF